MVAALAAQLAVDMFPTPALMHLKLGLILSLASQVQVFFSLESLPVVSVSHLCIHICGLVLYRKSVISDFLWLQM
jgi:hypothetical protein